MRPEAHVLRLDRGQPTYAELQRRVEAPDSTRWHSAGEVARTLSGGAHLRLVERRMTAQLMRQHGWRPKLSAFGRAGWRHSDHAAARANDKPEKPPTWRTRRRRQRSRGGRADAQMLALEALAGETGHSAAEAAYLEAVERVSGRRVSETRGAVLANTRRDAAVFASRVEAGALPLRVRLRLRRLRRRQRGAQTAAVTPD